MIILASQSPHRKMLLEQIGLKFECHTPDVDERLAEKDFTGSHEQLAEYLSVAKAKSLRNTFPEDTIIGSDQTLVFENEVFHKPNSKEEVIERLCALQGQTHHLITGLCVIHQDNIFSTSVKTKLCMRPLDLAEIKSYVEKENPVGCAGGYKIEGLGMALFEAIESPDHSSIVGLPLLSLVSKLREFGIFRL